MCYPAVVPCLGSAQPGTNANTADSVSPFRRSANASRDSKKPCRSACKCGARTTARIQPEWAERVGAHLCQHSYSEPRWQTDRGGVVATERVTLFGLPVVTGRTVDYGRIDPTVARELFIRHALVDGEWRTNHAFVADNRRTMDKIRLLEDRVRRRGILADEYAIFELFDERIPSDVRSVRHFDRWCKKQRESTSTRN